MDEIIAGVRAFQRDVYPKNQELFARLAAGQSPKAMIITCSDSRVDPLLLTQARPGEIFVLQNAGNLVPRYGDVMGGVTATIEFAVVELRVANIIICGHSGCGAVAGVLKPELVQHMPSVATWLLHASVVRESMREMGQLDASDALQRAVEANVIVQLDNLRTHPAVADAVNTGRVQLHGWVYHIGTGAVTAYDPDRQQFTVL